MKTCKFFVIEFPQTRFCPSTKEAVISFSPNPVFGDLKEHLHGCVCVCVCFLKQKLWFFFKKEIDWFVLKTLSSNAHSASQHMCLNLPHYLIANRSLQSKLLMPLWHTFLVSMTPRVSPTTTSDSINHRNITIGPDQLVNYGHGIYILFAHFRETETC